MIPDYVHRRLDHALMLAYWGHHKEAKETLRDIAIFVSKPDPTKELQGGEQECGFRVR